MFSLSATRNYSRALRSRRSCLEMLDMRLVLSGASVVSGDVPALVASSGVPRIAQPPFVPESFNDPPDGTDTFRSATGPTYTFSAADFGFSDPDDNPPDQFLAVKLTTLPAAGSMTLNGAAVSQGQFVLATELQSGDLQFTPSDTPNGIFNSFAFQVQDDGGLADGGSDLDQSPNVFTLIADSPQTNFIRGLYVDVLDRQPDLAGMQDWLGRLNEGATNLEVSAGIWESTEHRAIQVDSYYNQFFGRSADPEGRQFWIDEMLAGATEEDTMAAFMTTQEYLESNATNEEFVRAVYQDVLNRDADTGGLIFWTEALATGQMTREQVAAGLIDTDERHQSLVDSYYETYLDRVADPDGAAFWANQLNQNLMDDADVVEALLATAEYANLPH